MEIGLVVILFPFIIAFWFGYCRPIACYRPSVDIGYCRYRLYQVFCTGVITLSMKMYLAAHQIFGQGCLYGTAHVRATMVQQ